MSTGKTLAKARRVEKTAPETITVRTAKVMNLEESCEILGGVARGHADIATGRVKTTAEMKASVGKWFR